MIVLAIEGVRGGVFQDIFLWGWKDVAIFLIEDRIESLCPNFVFFINKQIKLCKNSTPSPLYIIKQILTWQKITI